MGATSSPDGKWLTAAYEGGPWFWSSDGGRLWSHDGSTRAWASVASSGDGSVHFAAEKNGYVYVTSDEFRTILYMGQLGQRRWTSLAASQAGKCRP